MNIRRPALTLAPLAVLVVCAAASAQPKEQGRKISGDEKKEFEAVTALLASSKPAINDLSLAWVGNDVFKAQDNKEYVPFTVRFDPSKVNAERLAIYWRVVRKPAPAGAASASPGSTAPPAARDARTPPEAVAYENLLLATPAQIIDPSVPSQGLLRRSFVVDPGEYDLFVVLKESVEKPKKGSPPKVSVLRREIAVPDLWNGELNTSSVIVAERIDPLPAPLTPAQREQRPYALGNMEIVPALTTTLAKRKDLSVFLLIYNAQVDASNAPDVQVEYSFYNVQNGTEKFFNKTNPLALNGQTVPAGYDPAAGITNGQTVPLATFPEGDYRLEIKITDKLANRSVTRDVAFSVAGS